MSLCVKDEWFAGFALGIEEKEGKKNVGNGRNKNKKDIKGIEIK